MTWNFILFWFPVPKFATYGLWKTADFRFEIKNGSFQYDESLHIFRVNCIHPQSFIQIGILVSEILGNTTKMNAILGDPR